MTILEACKVTKRFGGLIAVQEFDLAISEKEIVGLIGPNGAGKTTVFNMLACYFRPDSGQIMFRGADIVGHRPHEVGRLGLARTFQVTRPFLNNSVLENVMIGAFARTVHVHEARTRAADVLEALQFADEADRLAGELTTGDLKRLELARALATQPSLLLLDEVMAGLNPAEKEEMIRLLRRVRDSGVTLLVVEHDMRAVMALCERIVLMHQGAKLLEGNPAEVGRDPRAVAAYLGDDYAAS